MSGEGGRLDKEELREDEFVEWVMAAADYVRERYQVFLGALAVIAVVIFGANYLVESQARARQEAAAALGRALVLEAEGQAVEARRVVEEEVLGRFDGTPAAGQATVMLANRYFEEGRYEEAKALFNRYIQDYGDNEVLRYAAGSGLAAVLDAEGRTDEAAAAYLRLAAAQPNALQAALALWEAAGCFERLGDTAQRRQVLEQVVRDHGELPLATQAKAALETL